MKGLSANVIVRLKEQSSQEYDEWMQRDISAKHDVYVWADEVYAKVRLEDDANQRQRPQRQAPRPRESMRTNMQPIKPRRNFA